MHRMVDIIGKRFLKKCGIFFLILRRFRANRDTERGGRLLARVKQRDENSSDAVETVSGGYKMVRNI